MRILFLAAAILFSASLASAQKKAVTENGDEIILYNDGTWKYLNEKEVEKTAIPVNRSHFKKNKNSTFLLKSNRFNVGIWLDPKKWSFEKKTGDSEYEFELKNGNLYGMLVSEKIEIPLETLKQVALENGQAVAPDLKIVKEEYRTVNGIKVLMLKMNGTMQGIKFSYYGYYFSNENGTIQFITYTSQNLMTEHLRDCEEMLNGLVELD